jgi:hypothetical protein
VKLRTESAAAIWVLALAPVAAAAQVPAAPESSYAARALERLETRLKADSSLQLLLGGTLTGSPQGFDPRSLLRLSDSTLLAFAASLRTSLARTDDSLCGDYISGTAEGFMHLLESLDSAQVDVWLASIEQLMYAQAYEWPVQPSATAEEVEDAMIGLTAKLSEVELRRVAALSDASPISETCWFLRRLLAYLPGLPRQRAARVFRALMAAGAAGPDIK